MTVRKHAIGSQGLVASIEGLGTMGMTAVYGTPDDAESVATVHRALELDVTVFDTSDLYGAPSPERGCSGGPCVAAAIRRSSPRSSAA